MEELLAQISTIAKGMWRFRWQSLLVAWLVGAIGTVVVFRVPDRYEATARIYVDTQSILKPLMSGLAVQPNVEQQVVMLSRSLISRPNVEKLVRMADLDLKADSKAQQEALVGDLMTTLEIKNVGRDNLYALSYRDSDPAKAQRVIQSLVSIFVESSLGASRKDTATAKVFINEQIKAYEAKLEEAEARLKDFRLKNIQIQFAEGKDSASQLGALREQLDQAKLDLREAENARDAAKAQISSGRPTGADPTAPSPLNDPALSVATPEIDARIDAQKRVLDGLLQRFTEQHPDVIGTRRLINDLEEQKRKEVEELRRAALASSSASTGNPGNLIDREMKSLMAQSEVQIAGLRARVSEYVVRYQRAQESLKTTPKLEAEAAQLNRDYSIHRKNYEDLVARRESASMSGELEAASGVADFRLIDPPRVSAKPVSPNRLVLLATAFVAAIASGMFCAFAISQIRPVFHNAYDLRTQFELPVLGVVSRVMSSANKRREKVSLMRFLAGSGSLVGIFVVALVAMSIQAARQAG